MKATKNGICREIDETRKQEFLEKGYAIEGVAKHDDTEALKQENEALKQQLAEALKAQASYKTVEESEQTSEQVEKREKKRN